MGKIESITYENGQVIIQCAINGDQCELGKRTMGYPATIPNPDYDPEDPESPKEVTNDMPFVVWDLWEHYKEVQARMKQQEKAEMMNSIENSELSDIL